MQDAFQLYPTFLSSYHPACKQFTTPGPPEPHLLSLWFFINFLPDNYQVPDSILRMDWLHPQSSSHFCGCPSSSSHFLATLLPLGTLLPSSCFCFRKPPSTLGFLQREEQEQPDTSHGQTIGKPQSKRSPMWISPSDLHPTGLQMLFLGPWIWWWGGRAVKGICVLKLRDVFGCTEIIKQ